MRIRSRMDSGGEGIVFGMVEGARRWKMGINGSSDRIECTCCEIQISTYVNHIKFRIS
jgi:hypothetical protein